MLKQFGLTGLWLNADSEDEFNAGTVLGYSVDDWMSIKIVFWLMERLKSEVVWVNKLDLTVIFRTMGHNKIK